MILHAKLQPENVRLINIWNESGAALQFWRSVFERKAPETLTRLEQLTDVRQGNSIKQFDDTILDVVTDAYVEANRSGSTIALATEANGVLSK